MNGGEVVTAVNGAVDTLTTSLVGKAPTSHQHSGVYASSSHTHTAGQITGIGDSFSALGHKHLVSDITDIAGLLVNINDSTMTFDVSGVSGEYSFLNISNILFSGGTIGGVQPSFLHFEYSVTWNHGGSPTQVDSGRSTSSQMQFFKPQRSWVGWGSSGLIDVKISITAYNPFTSSSVSKTVSIDDVAKNEYYKITVEDLVTELVKDPHDPNSFIGVLKSQIQADLV